MPRPGPRRPLVAIRLSEAGIEHIDKRAEEAQVSRSEMIRRMLAYASAYMPESWQPNTTRSS